MGEVEMDDKGDEEVEGDEWNARLARSVGRIAFEVEVRGQVASLRLILGIVGLMLL